MVTPIPNRDRDVARTFSSQALDIVYVMKEKGNLNPTDSTETKRRILDAASEEFADCGFAGARVDRIARNAKANKQLIYRYYGSKQELYEAVFLDLTRRIREDEKDSAKDPGQSVFESMLGTRGEDEELTSLMIRTLSWEGLDAHATSDDVLQKRRNNYLHALEWVRGEQEAGRVRSDVLAEHIVALTVVVGGLPYATPNVFEFLFGRTPDEADRKEWRSFILEILRE